jgi:hypothetical protein
MNKLMVSFVVGVAFVAILACSADPGPMLVQALAAAPQQPGNLPSWITVEQAQDCGNGCWHVDSVVFEDADVSGGNHHVFVQSRDEDGAWYAGQAFHVAYPTGDDEAETKMPPDWGNVPVWACFSPDNGEVGPYWVYAGDEPTRSAIVRGIGLPECQHVNIKIVFRFVPGFPAPPTPSVTPTPTATATAPPTPTPCPDCPRLYLPLVQGQR